MTRIVQHLDGLALAGTATIGPIALSVPALLLAAPASAPEGRPAVGPLLTSAGGAEAGRRRLRIAEGAAVLDLDYAIPTPESTSAASEPIRAAPGVALVHWPLSEPGWTSLLAERPGLVILGNARFLFAEAEPLVRAVGEVRARLGAAPLLWAPRVARPSRVALLAYLGVDLLDTTEAIARAAEGEFADAALGAIDGAAASAEALCPCPACRAGEDPRTGRHAEWAVVQEVRRARAAIREGRLRELVEARLTSEPVLAELLRYADRDLVGPLDERSPVASTALRTYVLRESFRRPEVRRFRGRFLERYRPPPSKEVLLLVPCSQTKPYRNSPSHRRIVGALEELPNRARLHLVSVTSPLGLVPRELEDVPPARHYDIPVTGDWDEAERAAVGAALSHLLATGRYGAVLVHLDPEEYGFLRPTLSASPNVRWTVVDGRATSAPSLGALRAAALETLGPLAPVPGGALTVVKEELEALAGYQFGPGPASRLFAPPVRLQGRPWFQRLLDVGGQDLASWREARGLFHLALGGARRWGPSSPYDVEVREDLPLRGDLFTPGVAAASPAIRSGDAVRLVRGGELLGVGEAALPGALMTELPRGIAVYGRHRVRVSGASEATDTAMASDTDPAPGRSSSG